MDTNYGYLLNAKISFNGRQYNKVNKHLKIL